MKKTISLFAAIVTICFISCKEGKNTVVVNNLNDSITENVIDTTLYGKCGEGTMMSTLEIVGDDGSTTNITIDEELGSDIQGGLLCGDRMAVTMVKTDDGFVAQKVINLTTLLGHWTSLDRNFSILEDGTVESNVQAESQPYTVWNIVNAKLVLNTDTFDVLSLGADSLALENGNGIFVYKRQK